MSVVAITTNGKTGSWLNKLVNKSNRICDEGFVASSSSIGFESSALCCAARCLCSFPRSIYDAHKIQSVEGELSKIKNLAEVLNQTEKPFAHYVSERFIRDKC